MDLTSLCLASSIGVNCLLFSFALFQLRRSKKPQKKFDLTAQDLLHDLTRQGAAVLRVEVIDPSHLMLRSPRL